MKTFMGLMLAGVAVMLLSAPAWAGNKHVDEAIHHAKSVPGLRIAGRARRR